MCAEAELKTSRTLLSAELMTSHLLPAELKSSEVMYAELISSHLASDSNNLILKQFQQFDLGAPGNIAWGASSPTPPPTPPYVGPLLLTASRWRLASAGARLLLHLRGLNACHCEHVDEPASSTTII
jgi:hypothetical protein